MIFYFTIIAPLTFFLFRLITLSFSQSLFLLFILYCIIFLLRKLDRTDFFKEYTASALELKLTQEILYRTLLVEEFLLAHPFSGWFVLLFLTYLWIHFLILSQDVYNFFYWFFLLVYWYTLSYCRLRIVFLNDYSLNLYRGRSSFDWMDVLSAMATSLQLQVPIQNKIEKPSHSFSIIIPKRNMRGVSSKIVENPEVQRLAGTAATAAIAGAAAITAGVGSEVLDSGRQILATPEKNKVLALEKEVVLQEKYFDESCSEMNALPPHPTNEIAREIRSKCEERVAKAIVAKRDVSDQLAAARKALEESYPQASALTGDSLVEKVTNLFV
jgi:hypothetical protein